MRLSRCIQCQSFFPPAQNMCVHCGNIDKNSQDTANTQSKKAVKIKKNLLIRKGVFLLTGSALSVTLAACHGMPCAAHDQSERCKTDRYPCKDFTLDKDGDGYCGEWDCNENDKTIHHNADDPLGDHIDQDCNGVDGSLLPTPDTNP